MVNGKNLTFTTAPKNLQSNYHEEYPHTYFAVQRHFTNVGMWVLFSIPVLRDPYHSKRLGVCVCGPCGFTHSCMCVEARGQSSASSSVILQLIFGEKAAH